MTMDDLSRPRLGLVLGGGGARGLAHVGVVKVLQREGIPVDYLAGTSMGGLVGALYAANVPIDVVEEQVMRLSHVTEQMRLVDWNISSSGLSVRGRRIYNMLAELLGEGLTFADLKIPLAMVAVDIHSSHEIILQGGLVVDAVRATISVPGAFEPAELGDYRLVDGGVLNNVPVDVAQMQGATRTIAVDVLPSFSSNVPGLQPVELGLQLPFGPLVLNEVYHVLMIMIAALTDSHLRQFPPDVLIRPVLPAGVTLLTGFNRAADLIKAGEEAAEAALPDIHAVLAGERDTL